MGNDSWGVFLKNFLKNKRTPLNSSNREEKVGEKILNCKLLCRNRRVTNQLPKFENLLILGNRIKHISYLTIFKTDTEQHFILTIVWIKSKGN